METNLVIEGVKFMFLGMGIVFLFLILMFFTLKLQAYLINKYFPTPKSPESDSKPDSAKLAAAITAAIVHHKNCK